MTAISHNPRSVPEEILFLHPFSYERLSKSFFILLISLSIRFSRQQGQI